jgi:hypothetical protein
MYTGIIYVLFKTKFAVMHRLINSGMYLFFFSWYNI